MAVIVQYIVVRDGVEKMTFTTKKEADAYDKMLDIADNLYDFIETADVEIEGGQISNITLFLAENRDKIIPILRGAKPKPPPPKSVDAETEKAGADAPADKKKKKARTDNPGPAANPKPAAKRKKGKKK